MRHAYRDGEGPQVLVLVGSDWHPAELRHWMQDPDGQWWADVSWRRPMDQTFQHAFPRQRVWEDRDDIAPDR